MRPTSRSSTKTVSRSSTSLGSTSPSYIPMKMAWSRFEHGMVSSEGCNILEKDSLHDGALKTITSIKSINFNTVGL